MTRHLIVSSNLIVDEIILPGGKDGGTHPGGAALWAAIGARTAIDVVGVHAGVGSDFEDLFGAIFDRLDLSREALAHFDTGCIRSRLVYEREDHRQEIPAQGPHHFAQMQVTLGSLPEQVLPVDGTYIFRDLWPDYWAGVEKARDSLGTILWELQGDVAEARFMPAVFDRLALVDILSLNRSEALQLTEVEDSDRAIDVLLAGGAAMVVLREGADGALVATASERLRVRPPPGPIIDVTGGGNAFSGGFLAGFVTHSRDPGRAAQVGAAAAALVLQQYGAPDRIDRQAAAQLALKAAVTTHRPNQKKRGR